MLASWLGEPACISSRHCHWMSEQRLQASENTLRIVEEPHLMEHASTVVINALSGGRSLFIEREDPAQGERHSSAGRWKATPRSEVRPADPNFEHHAVLGRQAARDIDLEIGQRGEEALVVAVNRVPTLVVLTPRLIVIAGPVTEGRHDSWQVVGVFAPHVLLDERHLSADAVTENACHRKR